ncbi:MAG: hypothetical protein AAGK17_14125 [Pseudomonadota bacterium]
MIAIKTIGPIEAQHNDAELARPASRKSRALLAYLVLQDGPHTREALCSLLWEIPDDPRGALRWSLSKLRPVLNCDGTERLHTDRQQVVCDTRGLHTDAAQLRDAGQWADKSE